MAGKRKFFILSLFWGLLIVIMVSAGKAEAAGVKNLRKNKEYTFNLDGKGKKEKLSYSLTKKGIYKININGKTVEKIKLGSNFYMPCMQIFDINKKDKKLDIWVYAYSDSDDIQYSALYEYSNKKIKNLWNTKDEDNYDATHMSGCGFIASANGKGQFTVAMDSAVNCNILTGNHLDKVVFRLKNGKVKQVSDKTYYFYETHGSNNNKDKSLVTAGKTTFYTGHNKKGGTFTVTKGVKCYPKKMYIESETRVYVLFETKNGKKGWLCTDDFSYEKLPFSEMYFAG